LLMSFKSRPALTARPKTPLGRASHMAYTYVSIAHLSTETWVSTSALSGECIPSTLR
jgi:hypothetical protein